MKVELLQIYGSSEHTKGSRARASTRVRAIIMLYDSLEHFIRYCYFEHITLILHRHCYMIVLNTHLYDLRAAIL